MQAGKLSAQLHEWVVEYSGFSNEQVVVTEGLCQFLASRLAEIGVAEDDPGVVMAKLGIDGSYRKVRVTGTHGPRLSCTFADGSQGFQIVPVGDVHADDRNKLSNILERMQQEGKIQ